jgi:hypothetical protein
VGLWLISMALIRPLRAWWLRPLLLAAGLVVIFFDAYSWNDAARTATFKF